MTERIIDNFGRVHNYLRISLTDNCNLRCFYCMPEEEYAFTPHTKLMQADEIRQLAKLFVNNGVTKIRLTGGEPLVRKDAPEIIHALSELPVELTMTTNGIRIDDMLPQIVDAGFSSINISLDTLQKDRFAQITRRDYFDRVWRNIDLLLDRQIQTKLNVVLMKGLNDDEILDFVKLTNLYPLEVRFIEFMPFEGNHWSSNQVLTLNEILDRISEVYTIEPLEQRPHDTTKPFAIHGHIGKIAVISTMTMPFCEDCNRMRLTADGKLKNCLFSKEETDLLSALRNGEDVLPLIHQSIRSKPKSLGGQLTENFKDIEADSLTNRSMISIGG
ncbi:GTP 3',8-cyclase MoaA [Olivibacter sp. XZL3]|uniref:GTP 3',8-cyclase MoaA n=1 Tax=Olivibacter sp. XZL3 TaxID=1735116 RepID=UPI001066DF68|nr:GTP 3',8-cyclase MoaA [Olivibacter sp. XZL3]